MAGELVGLTIKEATEIILKDMPDADIVGMLPGMPETRDFRFNRVRLFVNTVATTPHVG